jgi:hypothetical protein
VPSASSADKATRVRRLEEPKAPVSFPSFLLYCLLI